MSLTDRHGRRINYLRLSVTDRCNLACRYCRPERRARVPGPLLDLAAGLRLVRTAVGLGFQKVRITGGEPLLRPGILPFLAKVAAIPGLDALVLTTNGTLLADFARDLRQAGVQRLNISLDSLDPATFRTLTGGGELERVLAGVAAAEAAGFASVKLNTVVMRGVNEEEVADLAALTIERPLIVRFIELMPVAGCRDWERLVVPGAEILARLRQRFPVLAEEASDLSGPARPFRIPGARGALGLITAMSCGFCETCNRIRVDAAGRARGCLFANQTFDLAPFLGPGQEAELAEAIRGIVLAKPDRRPPLAEDSGRIAASMQAIGG
ncbi:MAG: GTP 3',8-cyclase MoaA [Thermodesulfobacteriota bacterium]